MDTPTGNSSTSRRAILQAMLPNPSPPNAVMYVAGNRPPATGEGKGTWLEAAFATSEDAIVAVGDDADHGEMYAALSWFTPGRGRKTDAVLARDWVSADIDDKAMPGTTAEERHKSARRLAAAIPCGHVLVDSGGGFHMHLRLRQGQRIQDFAKRDEGLHHFELLGRALRLFLEQKHADLFGASEPRVRLDHCHGAERVWRIPPGVNCKAIGNEKALSADPTTWRAVSLVQPAHAEGIDRVPSVDLAFLGPFLEAAKREIAGAQKPTSATDDSAAPPNFDPSVLPPKLQTAWPMPEGDQSRHDFAVAAALAKLGCAPAVARAALQSRRSQLPDPADRAKAERSDYITSTVDNAYQTVAASATSAVRLTPLPPYRPFPVEALPEPVRSFVLEGAAAIGCDRSYIALPLLAALAAAIGNSRRVTPKRGWSEPSVLWTVVVGWSGTLKSPAIDLAMSFLKRRQAAALVAHKAKVVAYEIAKTIYDAELAAWKKNHRDGPMPQAPTKPIALRLFCSDTTVEALAELLNDAPRGLLVMRDELAGWFKSFDAYRQGRGGDDAKWLEMHRAGTLVVDRKSGTTLLFVRHAAVSVTGGIQPEILRKALGLDNYANGLAARLLLVMPPRSKKKWSEVEVSPTLVAAVEQVFERLLALELVDGEPVEVSFTDQGRRAFITFYDEHAKEQNDLAGDLAAAWSKLEGYAARLALIIHLVRVVAGDASVKSRNEVDAESVAAAIRLIRWFAHETERVYACLADSPVAKNRRDLLEFIALKGGEVTARELMRTNARYRPSVELAIQALDDLATAGLGQWVEVPASDQGGRPTRRFRLSPSTSNEAAEAVDTTPSTPGNGPVSPLSPAINSAAEEVIRSSGEASAASESPRSDGSDSDTTSHSRGTDQVLSLSQVTKPVADEPKPLSATADGTTNGPQIESRTLCPNGNTLDSGAQPGAGLRPQDSGDSDKTSPAPGTREVASLQPDTPRPSSAPGQQLAGDTNAVPENALADALSKILRKAAARDPKSGGTDRA